VNSPTGGMIPSTQYDTSFLDEFRHKFQTNSNAKQQKNVLKTDEIGKKGKVKTAQKSNNGNLFQLMRIKP
jgi:hypothetical protein